MGFVIKQVSDVGSANPIVARLCLQFNEIIEFYKLSDESKKDIKGVLFNDIRNRLLSCEKIAIELNNEINEELQIIRENGLKTQANERVIEIPYIIRLDERVESYLYNAKSCLRDALKIYNILFETNFNEARYDKVIKWARDKFGENDSITNFLRSDHDMWIHKLVKMRNAIEHPGGFSGNLSINNFEIITENNKSKISEPAWKLNDENESTIRHDLSIFINNILELVEDIVISSLEKTGKPEMLTIIEIPEEQRREEAPIRFKMGLAQKL